MCCDDDLSISLDERWGSVCDGLWWNGANRDDQFVCGDLIQAEALMARSSWRASAKVQLHDDVHGEHQNEAGDHDEPENDAVHIAAGSVFLQNLEEHDVDDGAGCDGREYDQQQTLVLLRQIAGRQIAGQLSDNHDPDANRTHYAEDAHVDGGHCHAGRLVEQLETDGERDHQLVHRDREQHGVDLAGRVLHADRQSVEDRVRRERHDGH